MSVTAIRGNEMWARDFDDPYSYSVTVQVLNRNIFAETSLISHWTAGETHSESSAFITQVVSNNGVENFPTQNTTGGDLVAVLYRNNATSITFKVECYQSKAMARWMIFEWV